MSIYNPLHVIKYCFCGKPEDIGTRRICPLSGWSSEVPESSKNVKTSFKVGVIGETLVGSTSLCKRFVQDEINTNAITSMGPDCWAKGVQVADQTANLQIWNIRGFGYSTGEDTSVELDWKPIKEYVCKGAHGVIFVYDVTSEKSFSNVKKYLEYLELDKCVIKVLAGNKIDKRDKQVVSYDDAMIFAKKNHMQFFQTSALENINVNEVFESMAKSLLEQNVDS